MNTRTDALIKRLENNLNDRKCFTEAHAPALKKIAEQINEGSVIINMDLARVLLDIIDGSKRHDEELTRLVEKERNKTIPALERKQ